ncbi:MAG: carbonic anhydrase [Candidatus Wenzhouxiangella sp. M2_3B_020]
MFVRLALGRGVVVTAAAALVSSSVLAASDSARWGYEGETGPANWGGLSTDFAACAEGRMQSPIDIDEAGAIGDLALSVSYTTGPLEIRNPGKTIQVDFEPGSTMDSGGTTFGLLQVHFHTPSEHTVNGEHFPLTAHFVHTTKYGQLGVLGVMYAPGEENAELQKIIDAAGDAGAEPAVVDGVTFDPNVLLPADLDIYRYMGSLTTPPCSEGVHWHVLEQPVEVSSEQIAALEELMGMNARPVQPLNNRLLVAPE